MTPPTPPFAEVLTSVLNSKLQNRARVHLIPPSMQIRVLCYECENFREYLLGKY